MAATLVAQQMPAVVTIPVTNSILFATAITGQPTNAVGTNGIFYGVGYGVAVPNADKATLSVTAQSTTTNAGNLVIHLVRSEFVNPPGYTTNAQWFETSDPANLQFTIPLNGTNFVTYQTNLDFYQLGYTCWIGCSLLTNTQAAGIVTNHTISLGTKIVPIRYP